MRKIGHRIISIHPEALPGDLHPLCDMADEKIVRKRLVNN